MGRILIGLIKGGVVGAALGYLAGRAGLAAGGIMVVLYGAIGAVVGLVCGKPLWRQETLWTPLLKAIVGVGVGVGVAFAARKLLGGVHVPIAAIPGALDHPLPEVPALLGPLVGLLYGAFVELDDAGGAADAKDAKKSAPASGPGGA